MATFSCRTPSLKGTVFLLHTLISSFSTGLISRSGEFHDPYDRRKSLTEEEIDEIKISSGGIGEISTRGRRGSEGRLDLFHDNAKICELHWENRGGEYVNLVEVLDDSDKYKVVHGGWSALAGPLGHVFVDISARKK